MPQSFADKSLDQFLTELASASPVPGGGTVAALGGALATSLLAMVCRLTIGKKGYEAVSGTMETLLATLEPLGSEFRILMQADSDAFANVMETYKLPRTSDGEKSARTDAIQQALKHAADVPLRVAELCSTLMDLARPIAKEGNKSAASDAGVGAVLAEACLRSATLNVTINLASIRDRVFVDAHRARVDGLTARAGQARQEILQIVEARL